ncbi:MAG: hypothetical protein QXP04_04145, partial [Candidatus Nanoarchaeia archaeon]|nr:hypothetical protein [Candidatus Jingweiarchaeum tengchongense]
KLFESMKEIAKKDGSEISFLYAGSGKYLYSIKAKTYKEGENKRTKIFEEADKIAKQNKIEFSIK